jgi:hypothetical protein
MSNSAEIRIDLAIRSIPPDCAMNDHVQVLGVARLFVADIRAYADLRHAAATARVHELEWTQSPES